LEERSLIGEGIRERAVIIIIIIIIIVFAPGLHVHRVRMRMRMVHSERRRDVDVFFFFSFDKFFPSFNRMAEQRLGELLYMAGTAHEAGKVTVTPQKR
jgi:hypothetical protein